LLSTIASHLILGYFIKPDMRFFFFFFNFSTIGLNKILFSYFVETNVNTLKYNLGMIKKSTLKKNTMLQVYLIEDWLYSSVLVFHLMHKFNQSCFDLRIN
jgi:hypothetical protein